MWLTTILGIIDKLLGVFGWFAKRSDASKRVRDKQQALMNEAAKKGDFNAWKTARHNRNRA